jgi:uncharacterized LabA/DUF88 family protein
MAAIQENVSMALFCDFENVALGVRDAKYEKFDIKPVLERLLLKGSIVVKKAYCDWDRYKGFKAAMHEANFELIEIPHVRQSGKNSADIRLVVDALDLCYTKSHVNTFVIISGDSDFSPLVSKLRENAKQVIGVGVKQSTSDLLIANCDEFIFYDDLVRESRRSAARRDARGTQQPAPRRVPDEEAPRRDELEARKTQAVDLAVETFDALVSERGDSGKIWASVLKKAIKRRKPQFSETYYGFRAFGNLLEEASARGLLELGRDEKSGTYVFRSNGAATAAVDTAAGPLLDVMPEIIVEPDTDMPAMPVAEELDEPVPEMKSMPADNPVQTEPEPVVEAASAVPVPAAREAAGKREPRRRGRENRKTAGRKADQAAAFAPDDGQEIQERDSALPPATPVSADLFGAEYSAPQSAEGASGTGGTPASYPAHPAQDAARPATGNGFPPESPAGLHTDTQQVPASQADAVPPEAPVKKPARKTGSRGRRPRKTDAATGDA